MGALPPRAAGTDPVDAYLAEGHELYFTHHLGPDRLPRAIALYEKALAERPGDYAILWQLSELYQMRGQLLGEGESKEQIALWEKGQTYGERAIEANPDGVEGRFYYLANMGAIAQAKGLLGSLWRFRKIKKALDRAYALDPNFLPVLIARAQYLTKMPGMLGGSEEEAIRLYRRVLELDPTYVAAWYYLAELDVAHGRYDEAAVKLKKVLEQKNPPHYANWYMLDRVWARKLLDEINARAEKE